MDVGMLRLPRAYEEGAKISCRVDSGGARRQGSGGDTALRYAAGQGHPAGVLRLLRAGADMKLRKAEYRKAEREVKRKTATSAPPDSATFVTRPPWYRLCSAFAFRRELPTIAGLNSASSTCASLFSCHFLLRVTKTKYILPNYCFPM